VTITQIKNQLARIISLSTIIECYKNNKQEADFSIFSKQSTSFLNFKVINKNCNNLGATLGKRPFLINTHSEKLLF
jgi:hypothetical protein